MKKPNKEIIKHEYAKTEFILVITDPAIRVDTRKSMVIIDSITVHVRYLSPIGVLVVRNILTKAFVSATPDWKDYCCHKTLEVYEQNKQARIKRLTALN